MSNMSRKQIGNIGPIRPKMDRATSKPLMEKRRRERINRSLNELKTILLEALRRDTTSCSKLEKADILEMTVRYLHSTKTANGYPFPGAPQSPAEAQSRYAAGFTDCKTEMNRALAQCSDISEESRQKIISSFRSPPPPQQQVAPPPQNTIASQYASMTQLLSSSHHPMMPFMGGHAAPQSVSQKCSSSDVNMMGKRVDSTGSVGTNGSDSESDTNSNDSFGSGQSKTIFRPW